MYKSSIKRYNELIQRDKFSAKAIFYVLIAEVCALVALRLCNTCQHTLVYRYVSFGLAILGVFFLYRIIRIYIQCIKENKKPGYGIRSFIITKLLSNAIVPSWLGVLYLFFFVIHIGWLTDSSLNLFLPKTYPHLLEIILSLVIGGIGITILVVFFPIPQTEKSGNETKVFVSGISTINGKNLIPLITPLKLAACEKCKMLILYTNCYTSFNSYNIKHLENLVNFVPESEIGDEIKSYKEYIKNCYEPFVTRGEDGRIIIKSDNDFNKELEKQKENIAKLPDIIANYIKAIIPIVAKDTLKEKCPQKIEITFTEGVDYNDFEKCYTILEKKTIEHDKDENVLYFNLTPGTGIVGALMALMSINGERKLYYYKQNIKVNEEPLAEADKSKIPLKNLLSQALDKIEVEYK